MTTSLIDTLSGTIAFLAGGALRLSTAWLGVLPFWLLIALTLGTFGWIFAKTSFSKTLYTPQIWLLQRTVLWSIAGFNLAVFLEG